MPQAADDPQCIPVGHANRPSVGADVLDSPCKHKVVYWRLRTVEDACPYEKLLLQDGAFAACGMTSHPTDGRFTYIRTVGVAGSYNARINFVGAGEFACTYPPAKLERLRAGG